MASIEKSIDVNVPVRTAYNQWTQFEQFPQFMEGVKEVGQLDNQRLRWRAEIGGKEKEWEARITEQTPDRQIAWRSTTGAPNGGTVSFYAVDDTTTRITLRLEYDPEGFVENVGDALGFVGRRVEGDLRRFKEFIESRGSETGAWRGEIREGRAEREAGRATSPPDAGNSGSAYGRGEGARVELGGSAEPTSRPSHAIGGPQDRTEGESTADKVIASSLPGIYQDASDGTIGGAASELREQARGTGERTGGVGEGEVSGRTGADSAGSASGMGADDVGGMSTGTGRGRGSDIGGSVAGGNQGGGSGGMTGTPGSGGLIGGTGGQGPARRSDVAGTGGGVAVSAGRGSDVGTVGGGMSDDLSSDVSGGMSGGTMGGNRETDVGGGLSGGMRSGMGADVSGGMGGSRHSAGDVADTPEAEEAGSGRE